MFHDAGAISYYGDGEVYDMLGLVTNHQADIANNGPGARFEFLEHLPAERRPTHFAYYPSWMGTNEFYGVDLRASKSVRVAGTARVELVAQLFNLFNTKNLQSQYGGGRVGNALSANFGRILTARDGTQGELAIKVAW